MPEPSKDRTARFRLRKAGLLPALPLCPSCGRKVSSQRTAPLCSICWKASPEGREEARRRMQRRRQRKQ